MVVTTRGYELALPETVRFGPGAIRTLGTEAVRRRFRHALVVTDPGVYRSGVTSPVQEQLSGANISVEAFSEVEPEPSLTGLKEAAVALRTCKPDAIVGVGGGSSMDTAKGLSVLLSHGNDARAYVGVNRIPGPCIPVFTVPTTAGTGSEVTNIAIFGDAERGLKVAMVSPYLLARLALVDPSLTRTCPPGVTAASGIDTLVHAIESYTSVRASNLSDALALQATRLTGAGLPAVFIDGCDEEARTLMSEAALLAGIAFGNAGVGAVHAFAYALGARFHVSHGVANGFLLPHVMRFNLPVCVSKYADIARALGGEGVEGLSLEEAASRSVAVVEGLAKSVGIPTHARQLGVPREALEGLASATMQSTRLLANNPRELTLCDARRIWEDAW